MAAFSVYEARLRARAQHRSRSTPCPPYFAPLVGAVSVGLGNGGVYPTMSNVIK